MVTAYWSEGVETSTLKNCGNDHILSWRWPSQKHQFKAKSDSDFKQAVAEYGASEAKKSPSKKL